MDTRPERLINKDFRQAFSDYLHLLEKRYPQKLILKMVGDRYALSGIQRSMLYRGVTTPNNNRERSGKHVSCVHIQDKVLHIDTLNVIITIGCYLNGRVVYLGTDGFLRDTAELHGKSFGPDIPERTMDLIINFLQAYRPSAVNFYIDDQADSREKISEIVSIGIREAGLKGTVRTDLHVDRLLIDLAEGIVASSDSTIMDRTHSPVVDLPYSVLQHCFHPDIIDLRLLQ